MRLHEQRHQPGDRQRHPKKVRVAARRVFGLPAHRQPLPGRDEAGRVTPGDNRNGRNRAAARNPDGGWSTRGVSSTFNVTMGWLQAIGVLVVVLLATLLLMGPPRPRV